MTTARSSAPARRVTLINPPSAPGTLANREGAAGLGVVYPAGTSFLYPPHTVAGAASALRTAHYQVRALDLVVQPADRGALDAEVIGVFVSWATLENDLAFLTNLRSQTAARLIALGSAARFVSEQIKNRAPVDAVLVGEAEGCIVEAVEYLMLRSRSKAPELLTAPIVQAGACDAEGLVRDLDTLPFPAWELLPYSQYQLLSVFASRGCPDSCVYCPYAAAQGHALRTRSVENVLAELKWLAQRFRPTRLVFRDPVFAYQRSRVVELCEGMLRDGINLAWECESRPDHFDAGLLRLMRRAGCRWVKLGLETTDESLLRELRRVSSFEHAAAYLNHVGEVVQACKRAGVQCRLFVMTGMPGQSLSAAVRTARFVEQIRPTALSVKRCEPYPSTGLQVVNEGDVEAQTETLLQTQARLQALAPSVGLLGRGRRCLRRAWHRVWRSREAKWQERS